MELELQEDSLSPESSEENEPEPIPEPLMVMEIPIPKLPDVIDRDQEFVFLELPIPNVRLDWWLFHMRKLPFSVVKELHGKIHVFDPHPEPNMKSEKQIRRKQRDLRSEINHRQDNNEITPKENRKIARLIAKEAGYLWVLNEDILSKAKKEVE